MVVCLTEASNGSRLGRSLRNQLPIRRRVHDWVPTFATAVVGGSGIRRRFSGFGISDAAGRVGSCWISVVAIG